MSRVYRILDALLHRLFARYADAERHVGDRDLYAASQMAIPFRTAVAFVYGCAWFVLVVSTIGTYLGMPAMGTGALDSVERLVPEQTGIPATVLASGFKMLIALTVGVLGSTAIIYMARWGLAFRVRRRRIRIERTLPGAVRYMRVLSTGTSDPASLLQGVVDRVDIHGETGRNFERVLATAAVTGDLDSSIRRVARQSASPDKLAPFLRTFLERSREGPEELRQFLERESRMLARRDERDVERESGNLTFVFGIFLTVLVLPTIVIVGLAAASVFFPSVDSPGVIPFRSVQFQRTVSTVGGVLILALGLLATLVVAGIRPSTHRWASSQRNRGLRDVLRGASKNPPDALLVTLPGGILLSLLLFRWGVGPPSALLLGYVAVGLFVGLVDRRRAKIHAARDSRLPGFVHAVSDRLDRGVPLATAVRQVSEERDFGVLQAAVADLSFALQVGTERRPLRKTALERFVDRVGTPLAGRTIGLATGALSAGSDTATAFAAMESETGRLAHAARARRARLPIIITGGWTAALFVIGVVVVMNLLATGTTAPTGPGPTDGVVMDLALSPLNNDRPRFYLIAQAAMLGSGWFAGVAGRGIYEGLLHSSGLVLVTFVAFHGAGLL
ncbi:MAG: hypothetical protein ABEJ27_02815 [Halodesulfurarchaeum sp.]